MEQTTTANYTTRGNQIMPQTYSTYRPTQFDQHISLDEQEDWLVLPINYPVKTATVRDQANYQAIINILAKADPSGELYDEHTFNHWAQPYRLILAHPSLLSTVEKIESDLEKYAILDEELLSSLEIDELIESFNSWGKNTFGKVFYETFECSETLRDFLSDNLTLDLVDLLREQEIYPEFSDADHLHSEIIRFVETNEDFDRSAAATWIKRIRKELRGSNQS